MKSDNIVKRLEKEGYTIIYKKWGYWDNIPHVELEGFEFAIAEYTNQGSWLGCNLDFIFNHVLDALELAKMNNPLILEKMNNGYWDYSIYLIDSMEDYYMYKKRKFPYDNYWGVINKLEKEIK